MKKAELKKAFDKEFNNIAVSNELKSKTLEAINKSYINKHSHIPYLKNFAAIFVVTMLCISIYFTRNSKEIGFISNSTTNQDSSISDLSGEIESCSMPMEKLNETSREATLNSYAGTVTEPQTAKTKSIFSSSASFDKTENTTNLLNDSLSIANIESEQSITLEKDFLEQHPDAEKIDNGYKIYVDNKEILYVFKDGILENIITID